MYKITEYHPNNTGNRYDNPYYTYKKSILQINLKKKTTQNHIARKDNNQQSS